MIDLSTFARALGYSGALVLVGGVVGRSLIRRCWNGAEDEPARAVALHRLSLLAFGATFFLLIAAWASLRHQALDLVDEGETLGAAQYQLALTSGWAAGWKAQLVAALFAPPFFGPRTMLMSSHDR